MQFPMWPATEQIENDEYEDAMLDADGNPTFHVAITFDGRSRNKRHFTSVMLVVKQAGFKEFWQKPKNIFTVGEAVGGDERANICKHFNDLWKECQDLLDGEKVKVPWNGTEVEVNIDISLPADMKAHWSLFGCGGMQGGGQQSAQTTATSTDGRGGARGHFKVCHRCEVTYRELEHVFVAYKVQASLFTLCTYNPFFCMHNDLCTVHEHWPLLPTYQIHCLVGIVDSAVSTLMHSLTVLYACQ